MSPLSILPKNKKGKFDKYIFPNIFFFQQNWNTSVDWHHSSKNWMERSDKV